MPLACQRDKREISRGGSPAAAVDTVLRSLASGIIFASTGLNMCCADPETLVRNERSYLASAARTLHRARRKRGGKHEVFSPQSIEAIAQTSVAALVVAQCADPAAGSSADRDDDSLQVALDRELLFLTVLAMRRQASEKVLNAAAQRAHEHDTKASVFLRRVRTEFERERKVRAGMIVKHIFIPIQQACGRLLGDSAPMRISFQCVPVPRGTTCTVREKSIPIPTLSTATCRSFPRKVSVVGRRAGSDARGRGGRTARSSESTGVSFSPSWSVEDEIATRSAATTTGDSAHPDGNTRVRILALATQHRIRAAVPVLCTKDCGVPSSVARLFPQWVSHLTEADGRDSLHQILWPYNLCSAPGVKKKIEMTLRALLRRTR